MKTEEDFDQNVAMIIQTIMDAAITLHELDEGNDVGDGLTIIVKAINELIDRMIIAGYPTECSREMKRIQLLRWMEILGTK